MVTSPDFPKLKSYQPHKSKTPQLTPEDSIKMSKSSESNKIKTLATIQPVSKVLDPAPKTLKYFPLRRTVKLFAIADALMASMLLISRYFIVTRIVTYPIFQLLSTSLYILISCFGIFQVFTVRLIMGKMTPNDNLIITLLLYFVGKH